MAGGEGAKQTLNREQGEAAISLSSVLELKTNFLILGWRIQSHSHFRSLGDFFRAEESAVINERPAS